MTTGVCLRILTITGVVEACRLDGYDNYSNYFLQTILLVVEACRLDGYDNS